MKDEALNIIEKVNENKYVKKTKKSLISLFFSRAGVFIILVLLQLALIFYLYWYIDIEPSVLLGGDTVLRALIMLIILNMNSINPSYKLSWFMLIAIWPTFASAVFLLDHFSIGHKKEQEKVTRLEEAGRKYYNRDSNLNYYLKENKKKVYNVSNFFYDVGGFVTYNNTSTKYYPVGEDVFADILTAIRSAKDFIFIEIFIIDYGHMRGSILEELVKKVQEGVEVRLLYDGTNSLIRVKSDFREQMESLGIKCRVFSPMIPIVSTYYNNRDHRKIFVIDNKIAFTGGINIADEYINVFERFGHWKDCGLRLDGSAVESFTIMFLQMWNSTLDEMEDFSRYLPKYFDSKAEGYVLPFGDSPKDKEDYGKNALLSIIENSKDYVYMMSPYLILEDQIILTMINASKRGIDVRICLPHIPDKKIAFALAKTHYKQLLENGVKIYEYTPGFCHSKTWLSDDSSGFVGTINLDYRALYLNYECGVLMNETKAISQMREDFDVFFNIATEINLEDLANISPIEKAIGFVAKPFATLF